MTRLADTPLAHLINGPMSTGTVSWIGLRPARKAAVIETPEATLVTGRGIDGDHYDSERNGPRQVTMIAAEDMAAIASFLACPAIEPNIFRRNLVSYGINLIALKNRRFRIGSTVLETSGECAPCSRMEEALGAGGYNAMRGRGGLTARVIVGGIIRIGDKIERVTPGA